MSRCYWTSNLHMFVDAFVGFRDGDTTKKVSFTTGRTGRTTSTNATSIQPALPIFPQKNSEKKGTNLKFMNLTFICIYLCIYLFRK
jgi:hypothetical protein